MKKLLFISNGHGEDLVAAEIIKRLAGKAEISVLPIVGQGQAFEELKAKILGPRKKLPSGGFSLRNLLYLFKDISSGLIGSTLKQIRLLRKLKNNFDLTVAIGDIVPIIGARFIKAPYFFIGVNKTDYYKWFGFHYTAWEKLLLRRSALKVYVRDKLTETNLKTRGIKVPQAEYVGNPLMDCFTLPKQRIRESDTKIIGFLPGTRSDAHLNMQDFEKIITEIIKLKNSDYGLKFITATTLDKIPAYMENMPFGAVLANSDLIIGLSGTGNEQAAGAGVPLISFYGRGSQYTEKFAKAQKQLLGDALHLISESDPLSIAAEVWHLLRNPAALKRMSQAGRQRMGKSGAADIISEHIKQLIQR